MKRVFLLLILLVFLAGCQNYYTPKKYTFEEIDERIPTYSYRIEVYENQIMPQTLTLKKDSKVTLYVLNNRDDINFSLDAFGIREKIVKGQEFSFSFIPKKRGSYKIYINNVPMGTIIVN